LDYLQITGLKVATRIGVHTWEQQIHQTLLLDICIPTDFKGCEDELSNTIDYDKLCKAVTHFVESKAFQLIETVAEEVAHLIKTDFKIPELTLSVSKPHAVKNAGNIQVKVTR
jgi:7,8-dihydroneopterin aldolase/epimerase/oxygenase